MKDMNALPNDPAILKNLLSQAMARNAYLEEQFRLAQQKRFGVSSEATLVRVSCLTKLRKKLA